MLQPLPLYLEMLQTGSAHPATLVFPSLAALHSAWQSLTAGSQDGWRYQLHSLAIFICVLLHSRIEHLIFGATARCSGQLSTSALAVHLLAVEHLFK